MALIGFLGPAEPVGHLGPCPLLSAASNFGARTFNLGNINGSNQKFLMKSGITKVQGKGQEISKAVFQETLLPKK